MMKYKSNIFILAVIAGLSVLPAGAETFCTGVSAPVRVDSRTGQVREAAPVETLTYSTNYVNGAAVGASVDITVNGAPLELTGGGTVEWTPSVLGTNVLAHCVKDADGGEVTNLTARFFVPYAEVETNGLDLAGATVQVLDAQDKPLAAATEGELAGKLVVASNRVITVTWTASEKDRYFADGTRTFTQTFTADKLVNPVREVVAKPGEPAAPNVKLGVVAQRYPWNGRVDVNCKVANAPKEAELVVCANGAEVARVAATIGEQKVSFDANKVDALKNKQLKAVKITAKVVAEKN